MNDILVPVQPQPLEAFEDRARALVGAARLVGVLDAQQELAAMLPSKEPVEERGARAAHVQVAGRGGRESQSRLRHRSGVSESGIRGFQGKV